MSSHELMFWLMITVVLGMAGLTRNSPRSYIIFSRTMCITAVAYFAFVLLVPA